MTLGMERKAGREAPKLKFGELSNTSIQILGKGCSCNIPRMSEERGLPETNEAMVERGTGKQKHAAPFFPLCLGWMREN